MTENCEVLLVRLYVLRANYFIWAVARLFLALPPLLDPEPAAPMSGATT